MAVAIPSRRVMGPRQQPCRIGETGRDSKTCRDQKAWRDSLITTANRVAIRSHPRGPTAHLMSRRAEPSRHQQRGRPAGSSISGCPQTIQACTHGEGSMEKAIKLTTKPRGLPIHPDWEGHKKSLP
ncbi:hypothetical protein Taro_039500 [Colocasia esculenta]|uniref:Uncharacterized protein n=1 Tax=Colocasia esculenta TaxID=4460 RepID=A0A843WFZ1_COLES|nr:hypothetical protein [Colocasia esculenta]